MLVEIYSDVVCPWCSIGKARFEKALAQFPDRDMFQVIWRPYQLDPNAPLSPTPAIDGYARKFGGPERARQIIDTVTEAAAGEGIEFHMDIAMRANTFDAHRLIGHALRSRGNVVQGDVKNRLLSAYFSEGRNIADPDVLADIAEDAGFDREEVLAFLESPQGVNETREELVQATEMGITAVPTFIFNGQWSVPGAQDTEVFLRVFERLAKAEADAREAAQTQPQSDPSLSGEACAIDDPNC